MSQVTQPENKQDNYSLSIISMLLSGAALLIFLFIMHLYSVPTEIAEWALDAVIAFESIAFVSNLVSGNGYFFQLFDKLFHNTTLWQRVLEKTRKKSNEEHEQKLSFWQRVKPQLATTIGLTVGIVGAVVTTTFQVVKHAPVIGFLAHAGKFIIDVGRLFFDMSSCGGLGNRIGRVIDLVRKPEVITKKHLRTKNINYAVAIFFGILIGIALAVIIIHTGGAALPVAVAAISALSSSASASGYIGRVCDTSLGKRTIIHAAKDFFLHKVLRRPMPENQKVSTIGQRMNREAIGTTIGVGVGIALGIILIVAGVATLPFFGFGSIKIVAGALLLSACVSTCGGLGNRIGYFWDKLRAKKKVAVAAVAAPENEEVQSIPPNVPGESNVDSQPQPEVRQGSYQDITATLQEQRLAADMPPVVEKPSDENIMVQVSTLPEREPSKTGKNYSCKMAPKFTMFKPSIQELQKPDEQFLEMPTHHSYAAVAA